MGSREEVAVSGGLTMATICNVLAWAIMLILTLGFLRITVRAFGFGVTGCIIPGVIVFVLFVALAGNCA